MAASALLAATAEDQALVRRAQRTLAAVRAEAPALVAGDRIARPASPRATIVHVLVRDDALELKIEPVATPRITSKKPPLLTAE